MAIYRFDTRDSNSNKKNKKNAARTKADDHCDYVAREGKYAPKTKAESHSNYVTREGNYTGDNYEDLVYAEHFNMPNFAKDNPKYFWECAEKYESPNWITYKEFEISLPYEFSNEQNINIAKKFCDECFGKEFAYSMGIHKKISSIDGINNIHFHVMFNERELDSIERSEEMFFKRGNRKKPEMGGNMKNPKWHAFGFIKDYRKKWEIFINKELELEGLEKVSSDTLYNQKLQAIKEENYAKAELLDRIPINLDGTIMIKIKQKGISSLSKYEKIEYEKYIMAKEMKDLKEKNYLENRTENFMVNNTRNSYMEYLENRAVETYLKNKLSDYQDKLSLKNSLNAEEKEIYTNLLLHVNESLENLRSKKEFSINYNSIDKDIINNSIRADKDYFEQSKQMNAENNEILYEIDKFLNFKEEIFINDLLISNDEVSDISQLMKKIELENDKMCKYNFLENEKTKLLSILDEKRIQSIAVSKLSEIEKNFYNTNISTGKILENKELKYKNQILNKLIRSSEKIKEGYQKKLTTLSTQQEEYKNFSNINLLVKGLDSENSSFIFDSLHNQYLGDIKKYNAKIETLKIVQNELQKNTKSETIITNLENKKARIKDYILDVREKGYDSIYLKDIRDYEKENISSIRDKLIDSKNLELGNIELILSEKYNELIKKEKYSESAKKNRISNQIKSLYSNVEITEKKIANIREIFSNNLEKEDSKTVISDESKSFKELIIESIEEKSKYDLIDYKINRLDNVLNDKELSDNNIRKYYENSLSKLIAEKSNHLNNKIDLNEISSNMSNEEKRSLFFELQNIYNDNIDSSRERIKSLNNEIAQIETNSENSRIISSLLEEKAKTIKSYLDLKTNGDYSKCLEELKPLENNNSHDRDTLLKLEMFKNKKVEYEQIKLDNSINNNLQKYDVELTFHKEKQNEKVKYLKNEIKELYFEVQLYNYCKANASKSLNYINYVFEDRKKILEYKNNSNNYSARDKLNLENQILSKYFYLEDMKTHIKDTLANEGKLSDSVIAKLDKENQKIYKNYIEQDRTPEDKSIYKQKDELINKINISVFNLKNYYDKKLSDLSKEQEFYYSKNDIKDILKGLSTNDKKSYVDDMLKNNNTNIRTSMKEVNDLENRLMKIDNDPVVIKIISKLEANRKDVQKYALNVKTEGKYFKCINEIEVLKNNDNNDLRNQSAKLDNLIKLKSEYEKLDVKEFVNKLTSTYNSIIQRYQKTKLENVRSIKTEIQKKYTEIKTLQLSNKIAKDQLESTNNKNKTHVNISTRGTAIHGTINMNEGNKKKEKDSATKMLTEQIDGIEY